MICTYSARLFPARAWVAAFLLADGGTGVAAVVMSRQDDRLVREGEQLASDAVVLVDGSPPRSGPTCATDEQGVAGKDMAVA